MILFSVIVVSVLIPWIAVSLDQAGVESLQWEYWSILLSAGALAINPAWDASRRLRRLQRGIIATEKGGKA